MGSAHLFWLNGGQTRSPHAGVPREAAQAMGIRIAWGPPPMLALPHLLGTECIATLTTMGFHVMARNAGRETLQRGSTVLIVPKTALAPAVVAGLLRAAGVDPFEFLRALEQHQRGRTLSQGASQDASGRSAPRVA